MQVRVTFEIGVFEPDTGTATEEQLDDLATSAAGQRGVSWRASGRSGPRAAVLQEHRTTYGPGPTVTTITTWEKV